VLKNSSIAKIAGIAKIDNFVTQLRFNQTACAKNFSIVTFGSYGNSGNYLRHFLYLSELQFHRRCAPKVEPLCGRL